MSAVEPGPAAGLPGFPWRPRQIILGTLVVLGVAGIFALLPLAGTVLPYFLVGLVVAVASEPVVAWLVARRLPRPAAALVMLAFLLAVGAGAMLLLVPTIVEHVGAIRERLPSLCTSARAWAQSGPSHLLTTAVRRFLPPDCGLNSVVGAKWGYVESLGDPLWAALAALVGAYAWITERLVIQRAVLKLVSPDRRDSGRALIDEIDHKLGAFVRGQAVLSLVIGVATAIFYLVLGVHGALPLGTLAALLEVIPVAGPLAAAAVGLMATAVMDPSLVPWVIAFAVLMRLASDYWLTPVVMGKSVGINPLLLLLTLVALGSAGGIIGAMVAVPIAVLLQIGLARLLAADPQVRTPEGRDAVSLLRYRATALAVAARRMGRQRAALGRECIAEDGAELLALRLAEMMAESDNSTPPAAHEVHS